VTDPRPDAELSAADAVDTADASEATAAPAASVGHPEVDEVVASFERLDALPVDQHVTVFESAHDRLRAALDAAAAPHA